MTGSLLFGLLTTWITPVWLLSVGAALGVAVLALGYGVLRLISRRAAEDAVLTVQHSVIVPIIYLALFLCVFAFVGTIVVPYRSLLGSVKRLPYVGESQRTFQIPAAKARHEIPLNFFVPAEVRQVGLQSNGPVTVSTHLKGAENSGDIRLQPKNKFAAEWKRPAVTGSIFDEPTTKWYVRNTTGQPVELVVRTVSDIEYPQVRIIPLTAIALVSVVLFYLLLPLIMPKIAAIALTTAKESIGQPLFYVTLILGTFALLAFIFVPYNTFGEDVKVLKDSGLTLIMVLSIIVAVWSASVSVADEIEGRTALTLLSKPVGRRQFIFGKFLGILLPVFLMFVLLGSLFLVSISYKMVYDAREVSQPEPTWQACYAEMISTLPGLVLAFFEAVVLAAISVAISTRLPMLANLIICSSIYVLGHLVPMVVNSSVGKFEIVSFVGKLLAAVLPVLDHFNIQAAVAAGVPVPLSYLGWALLYCLLYSTLAMLLALILFEDRDLA